MRYDPNLYLYTSARIRALEHRLVGRDKLLQLLELRDTSEILDALAECGISNTDDPLTAPESALRAAFRAVAESLPDSTLPLFVQYPYDAHNIKALEKCRIKGIDPAPLLIDLGSVSVEALLAADETELAALLPVNLAAGLLQAREDFAKTADPRRIDFALDRAMFADMAAAAAPFALAAQWVAAKADLTDLLICCRLLRMNAGETGAALLAQCITHAGTLTDDFLADCYTAGEDALVKRLADTPYAGIFEKALSFTEIERRVDDFLLSLLQAARAVTFGEEIPIAYLIAADMQCKNLRILLAGKQAGEDRATIQAKMRKTYV